MDTTHLPSGRSRIHAPTLLALACVLAVMGGTVAAVISVLFT